jgi:hypothetical protein
VSSRPAARVVNIGRPESLGYSRAARARRDTDALLVTKLTVDAKRVALNDLLLLGTHVYG